MMPTKKADDAGDATEIASKINSSLLTWLSGQSLIVQDSFATEVGLTGAQLKALIDDDANGSPTKAPAGQGLEGKALKAMRASLGRDASTTSSKFRATKNETNTGRVFANVTPTQMRAQKARG